MPMAPHHLALSQRNTKSSFTIKLSNKNYIFLYFEQVPFSIYGRGYGSGPQEFISRSGEPVGPTPHSPGKN